MCDKEREKPSTCARDEETFQRARPVWRGKETSIARRGGAKKPSLREKTTGGGNPPLHESDRQGARDPPLREGGWTENEDLPLCGRGVW